MSTRGNTKENLHPPRPSRGKKDPQRNREARPMIPKKFDLVQSYTHMLLFWVVFSFIIFNSIITGIFWGWAVATLLRMIPPGAAHPGGITWDLTFAMVLKSAIGLCICVCVLFAVTAMEYHADSGYRLKRSIFVQLLRFMLFVAVLTLAAVSAWHLLPFRFV